MVSWFVVQTAINCRNKVDIHDISSMEIDTRGAVWLGTHGHGFYRIVPEYRRGEVVKYTVMHFNAHNSTLLSDNIETLLF